MTAPLWAVSGAEAIRLVATGQAAVSDLAAAARQRAEDIDGGIGAWRIRDDEAVAAAAKELDGGSGPLAGLLVGVKDVIDTADLPTGYGSELFSGHQPTADADVVRTLRRAGATVLGKTESTEFAMFRPARTRNPFDPERTPGGSSSGSAAAVASGMAAVALGTQTAGSVVRPAAYCGVYGYKPARGWTSTRGIWLLAQHLDTVGLFARRAADLVVMYRALAGPTVSRVAATHLRPAAVPGRAAVLDTDPWAPADGDVDAAIASVAGRLADHGWAIDEMKMPAAWRALPELQETVMAVEVAHNLRAALGSRVDQISEAARMIIDWGSATTAPAYLSALAAVDAAVDAAASLAEHFDLLLCPSAPGVAPHGLASTGDPVMCRPATVLGLPAANLPYARRPDGMPVGVQAISPRFDDAAFLADLVTVEAAFPAEDVAPLAQPVQTTYRS
ncbi:MAG TPA: amidase [Acidimicrobiales bacterium]|nr:amidase [Acidimicrobiales bacterium]